MYSDAHWHVYLGMVRQSDVGRARHWTLFRAIAEEKMKIDCLYGSRIKGIVQTLCLLSDGINTHYIVLRDRSSVQEEDPVKFTSEGWYRMA